MVDIDAFLVLAGNSLIEALGTMEHVHMGIVLVVSEEGVLVGVVTDGDIRRALMQGKELSEPVDTLMTRDPLCVSAEASDPEVVEMFRSEAYATRRPAWIPAVDGARHPVKLYSAAELSNRSSVPQYDLGPATGSKKVLVIGGAGYLGSVLVRLLLDSGYRVTVLDKLFYGDASLKALAGVPEFEFVQGDTRHIDDIIPVITRADAVVHLAELVGDPLCSTDSQATFEINYLATSLIARICSDLQISRLVYASSCSVYGASEDPDAMLDESSPLAPVSLYAKLKINSERAIADTGRDNFSPCILRFGTLFGMSARPRFDLVVNTLAAKAIQEGEIQIYGGDQWRPFVHVLDASRAIKMVLEAPIDAIKNQVFNVVGENRKITEIGDMIADMAPGTKVSRSDTATDIRNYRVSADKAKQLLGFTPSITVADGIREVYEAFATSAVKDYKESRYHNFIPSPASDP